ncbi:MAG: DUF2807 domain-containing protein [Dysgonamonadaceae bacterium]|jgi:hypothetical protein|nr:DUF2807 domain-containing protein [Dysgonamonadaceae bacterium]
MKTKGLLFIICIFVLAISACSAIVVKESRNLDSFNKIKVESGIDIYFSQQNSQRIEVEASDEIIKKIITEVIGDELIIKRENNKKGITFNRNSHRVKVYVFAPAINNVNLSGGSDFFAAKVKCEGSFKIQASGGSDVNIDQLAVSGSTDVSVSGGSDCRINDLDTKNCSFSASGGSDLDIHLVSADNASVSASGGSDIKLSGTASDVSVSTSGGSDVYVKNLNYNNIVTNKSGGSDIYQ